MDTMEISGGFEEEDEDDDRRCDLKQTPKLNGI